MNRLVHDFAPVGQLQMLLVDAYERLLQHAVKWVAAGEELQPALLVYIPDPSGVLVPQIAGCLDEFQSESDQTIRNARLSSAVKGIRTPVYAIALECYADLGSREVVALTIAGASVGGDRLRSVCEIQGKARRRILLDAPIHRALTRAGEDIEFGDGLAELLD